MLLTLAGVRLEASTCPAKLKLAGFTVSTAVDARGLTVNTTVARLLESALLVAVTLISVAALTAGAVNKPDELTVPADADQVTALFRVFLTAAVNCRVFPEITVAFEGDAETLTAPLLALLLLNDEPPQPASEIAPESIMPGKNKFKNPARVISSCQQRPLRIGGPYAEQTTSRERRAIDACHTCAIVKGHRAS
jgi:hypothetical protein